MNATVISAIVRHVLTALAGGLAVKYSIDGGTVEAIIGGVSAGAGLLWSLADKKQRS